MSAYSNTDKLGEMGGEELLRKFFCCDSVDKEYLIYEAELLRRLREWERLRNSYKTFTGPAPDMPTAEELARAWWKTFDQTFPWEHFTLQTQTKFIEDAESWLAAIKSLRETKEGQRK